MNQNDEWKLNAVKICLPEIRYFAFKYRVEGMEIDDQIQELKLHLYRKLDKFDPSKSSVKTFANRITRNKCIDLDRCINKEKRKELRRKKALGLE